MKDEKLEALIDTLLAACPNPVGEALNRIMVSGGVDGAHHKQWVLDQVVRILTECPVEDAEARDCHGKLYHYKRRGRSHAYNDWVRRHNQGEDGPDTYEWSEGVPP